MTYPPNQNDQPLQQTSADSDSMTFLDSRGHNFCLKMDDIDKNPSLILDTVIMIHVCLGSFIYRATKEEEKAAIGKFD